MSGPLRTSRPSTSGAGDRVELAECLRARRSEIEDAFLTRASAIGALEAIEDSEYQDGFRRAVVAAFDFTLMMIEGVGEVPQVPVALLSQARLAARHSVGLDTVLRRYSAGSALLDGIVLSDIDQSAWLRGPWQHLTYDRAAAFDFLIAEITDEYCRELSAQRELGFARTRAPISRILDGEVPDRFDLEYDFTVSHVALVAEGPDTRSTIRDLAHSLDGRTLIEQTDKESTWAWIGRGKRIRRDQLISALRASGKTSTRLGVGEPGDGLLGWRRSHRQAKAAFLIAVQGRSTAALYGDVCVQASIAAEPLLAETLHAVYVEPLIQSRKGDVYLDTLRQYLATGRNAASTAGVLGVSRQTVAKRLQAVEDILGCPLLTCADTVSAALRFHDWQAASMPDKC